MLKTIFKIFLKKNFEQHSANSSCKTFLLFFQSCEKFENFLDKMRKIFWGPWI